MAFAYLGTAAPVPTTDATEPAPTYQLEEIVCTDTRLSSPEAGTETIRMETSGKAVVSTVPDAMDTAPGIDIQRRGILTPKSSQVRLRGLDERRSLVLLNGRPLNGTGVMGGYFVDWASLSTQQIDTIDITKGAFSARFGNSLGGAIDLKSDPPEASWSGRVGTGYKRYDTFSATAAVSGRQDPFAADFSAGYNRTDGHLRNSQAERTDAAAKLYRFQGDDGQLSVSLRHSRGDFHMPVENRKSLPDYDPDFPEHAGDYLAGPGIVFPGEDRHGDGSYFTKARTEADIRVEKRIGSLDAEAIIYFNYEERTDHIYSAETGQKVLKREAVPDRSWGWRADLSRPGENHRTGFGLEGNYQGYGGADNRYVRPDYFGQVPMENADDWDATRWHGLYVDDLWHATPTIELYAGLRYDDYSGDRDVDRATGYNDQGRPTGFSSQKIDFHEGAVQPKFGVIYTPLPSLSISGRAARAVRFPDNPAFYWYYAGYQPEVDSRTDVIRKELTFEDAVEYEAGIVYTGFREITVSGTLYYYRVDDYIRWIFGYAPSRVVYNIDRVDFTGAEIDLSAPLGRQIRAFANFSRQDTNKRGDVLDASNALTDSLPELPEYKFNCGVSWERPDGARAKMTLRWVDERQVPFIAGSSSPDGASQFAGVTELRKMSDFVTIDLSVKYPVLCPAAFAGFLAVGVENLTDETYEEEYDFPAPARTFYVGAEVVF